MTELIFAFRSFANAPDYRSQPLGLLGDTELITGTN